MRRRISIALFLLALGLFWGAMLLSGQFAAPDSSRQLLDEALLDGANEVVLLGAHTQPAWARQTEVSFSKGPGAYARLIGRTAQLRSRREGERLYLQAYDPMTDQPTGILKLHLPAHIRRLRGTDLALRAEVPMPALHVEAQGIHWRRGQVGQLQLVSHIPCRPDDAQPEAGPANPAPNITPSAAQPAEPAPMPTAAQARCSQHADGSGEVVVNAQQVERLCIVNAGGRVELQHGGQLQQLQLHASEDSRLDSHQLSAVLPLLQLQPLTPEQRQALQQPCPDCFVSDSLTLCAPPAPVGP
ncbi:hypothetical protein EBQ34_11150 [Vandammella animalimorsus]|uniref:Uncharacterized protein n=1 Tax=Vandammella animalimorsus TaxID=2029117 RepID=A0A3M6R8F4_9BURK|nr:hypothetical protein [Vandammella animalimorsus]RMX10988.1 hypothetical protein EBQ34_11150 [Vandammella animalimorsus]